MTARRWLFLRVLRWRIQFRALPAGRKSAIIATPFAVALAILCAHWFRHHRGLKTETWTDVILGTITLAIVPLFMAAYGGHIAAEGINDPKHRRRVKLYFWLACIAGVVLAFLQQYRAITQDAASKEKTGTVETAVLDQLKILHEQKSTLTPEETEAKRRESIMTLLRGKYILQNTNVSSGIVDGSEPLPADWVNQQLQDMNESWTVSEHAAQSGGARPARTYGIFVGTPLNAGHDPEGSPLQVGDSLCFNIHYAAKGQNLISLVGTARAIYLEPDFSPEIHQKLAREFEAVVTSGMKTAPRGSSTMTSEQSHFTTAYPNGANTFAPHVLTQDEFDRLKAGSEIVYVLGELIYRDNGVLHHTRECLWLQTPMHNPPVWHYCDVFNNSD